ncbi:hypothetical protein CATYP_07755 [Corynebacterium atypicum]|uniref:Uncharacterized protein n=1 Tax=Corynebacterium atypicum TaxID=191610 RepID=A0ABM5QNS7_9CORY|nr:ribonuclease domain-containing protein [Corynebacterium atypicum]AIG64496.1 hypothetical protein CATYP_07755 [Corynebacterium atypicum]
MSAKKSAGPLAGASAVLLAVAATWFGLSTTDTAPDPADTAPGATDPAPNTTETGATSTAPNPADSPRGSAASSPAAAPGGVRTCPLAELPDQAAEVTELVVSGGPFKHPNNDGTRFGNYEGHLPDKPRDYYREYTVDTPGLSHRGQRRIITGGTTATNPERWYYTADHYDTFCEIPDAPQASN